MLNVCLRNMLERLLKPCMALGLMGSWSPWNTYGWTGTTTAFPKRSPAAPPWSRQINTWTPCLICAFGLAWPILKEVAEKTLHSQDRYLKRKTHSRLASRLPLQMLFVCNILIAEDSCLKVPDILRFQRGVAVRLQGWGGRVLAHWVCGAQRGHCIWSCTQETLLHWLPSSRFRDGGYIFCTKKCLGNHTKAWRSRFLYFHNFLWTNVNFCMQSAA